MQNSDAAERIGRMFVKCLKNVISEENYAEVVRRNVDVADACASHDFCDANMVMQRADDKARTVGRYLHHQGHNVEVSGQAASSRSSDAPQGCASGGEE